jgi:transposase InsO family protein
MEEHVRLKKERGGLRREGVEHHVRDQVVDFVSRWSEKTEISRWRIVRWLEVPRSKLYDWIGRYGKVNEHNAWVPRDHWLEEWERKAIVSFFARHPRDGYRRLTYMMLDEDVAAVSPSTTCRVLASEGLLERWNRKASKKGTGFVQPIGPHEHWHVDIAYVNLGGTFWYLCVVLDGYSRYLVHWDLKPSMKEEDVELILQKAKEKFPEARPRIISDNGPQFIAREFKEFIRLTGMTHVRTSPYYPQSNGKCERVIQTVKVEGIRPASPADEEEAREVIEKTVRHYNEVRLHGAIGYLTPKDKLEGCEEEIFAERDRKLEAARARRAEARAKRSAEDRKEVAAVSGEAGAFRL